VWRSECGVINRPTSEEQFFDLPKINLARSESCPVRPVDPDFWTPQERAYVGVLTHGGKPTMSPKGGGLASERGRSWPRLRENERSGFLPHLIALFERLARGSHGKSHRYPLSASMSLPSCYITLALRLTHYLSETQSCVKPQPMRG